MLAARVPAVLVAIIVAGWFGLGTQQTHSLNAAEAILANANGLNRGQARHVSSLLSSAATLNPDRQVDVLRGDLASIEGHRAPAARIFLAIVHSEPQNVVAWYDLANATANPHTLTQALRQIAKLAPDIKSPTR